MTQTLQDVTPSYNMKWKYSYEIKIYIERKSFLKLLFVFWQNSLFLFLKWIVNTTTSIAQHYLFISIKNIATSIQQHYYITLFPHYEKGIFLVHLYSVGERLIVCVYVVLWWGGKLGVENIHITTSAEHLYYCYFISILYTTISMKRRVYVFLGVQENVYMYVYKYLCTYVCFFECILY